MSRINEITTTIADKLKHNNLYVYNVQEMPGVDCGWFEFSHLGHRWNCVIKETETNVEFGVSVFMSDEINDCITLTNEDIYGMGSKPENFDVMMTMTYAELSATIYHLSIKAGLVVPSMF